MSTTTAKVKKPTRATLERKIFELEAQLIHRLGIGDIDKASTDHLMGSAVVLQLTVLGGRNIMEPVAIRDGLSKETIEAIKADIRRSFEVATMFKPKGV